MKKSDRNRTLRRQRIAQARRVNDLKRVEAARLRKSKADRLTNNGAAARNWGYRETHHLIEERVPPPSLVRLRNELPRHPDIYQAAQAGNTIEECFGIIGARLDIVLDGMYDVDSLCDVLCNALENRGKHGNSPHMRDSRLINAELVEREGEISLEEGPGTIAPKPKSNITGIMESAGCAVCENIAACTREDKCLGSSALEAGLVQ